MPFRVCPLSRPKEHLGTSLQKSQCWDRTPKCGCLRWQAQLYKTGSENLKGSFNIRRDRNHLANPPPNFLGRLERTGDGKCAKAFDSN